MTLALNKMLIGWCLGALATMVLVSCGESTPTTETGGPTDQTQGAADAAKPSNTPDTSSGLTLIPATTQPTLGNPISSPTPLPQATPTEGFTTAPTLTPTPTPNAARIRRPTETPAATNRPTTRPMPTLAPAQAALRPLAVQRAFTKLEFSKLTNLVQPDDPATGSS